MGDLGIQKIVEVGGYEGFEYAIIKRSRLSKNEYESNLVALGLFTLSNEAYYCGYVKIPDSLKDFQTHYDNLEQSIFCHGGLAFSGELKDLDGYWIGFDCAHYSDNIKDQDLTYVKNECLSIIDQIIEGIVKEAGFQKNFGVHTVDFEEFVDIVEEDEHAN